MLSAALMVPIVVTPVVLQADKHKDERKFHDNRRKDDHEWNNREDQAYRMCAKGRHRPYVEFEKLEEQDRQSYWGWRHGHSDALLKIEIH